MRSAEAAPPQFEDEEKDEKAKADEEEHKLHWYDFWKHYVFWSRWMPLILTILLFVIGWSVFIWRRETTVAYFEVSPGLLLFAFCSQMPANPCRAESQLRLSAYCAVVEVVLLLGLYSAAVLDQPPGGARSGHRRRVHALHHKASAVLHLRSQGESHRRSTSIPVAP